jgi:hypothetical protein
MPVIQVVFKVPYFPHPPPPHPTRANKEEQVPEVPQAKHPSTPVILPFPLMMEKVPHVPPPPSPTVTKMILKLIPCWNSPSRHPRLFLSFPINSHRPGKNMRRIHLIGCRINLPNNVMPVKVNLQSFGDDTIVDFVDKSFVVGVVRPLWRFMEIEYGHEIEIIRVVVVVVVENKTKEE